MAQIKETLLDRNPWWKGEFELMFKDRAVHEELDRFMHLPQMIALTGLRRVGKTTLMLRLAKDRYEAGLDPRDIIYFSFDEFRGARIRDVIREYELIMGVTFRDGARVLLLDEIQKLDDWENQLKAVYDTYKDVTKIIISGSESLFIRRGSRATLAGRLFEFRVEPLTFREYLGFKGVSFEPVGLHEAELAALFREFMLTQGFPELVGITDKAIVLKYLRESIVEKVIYRDMPGLFGVRDAAMIESLLNIIMEGPGRIVLLSELADLLNVSRQTVSNYLSYLEDSFLVRKLYNYSTNRGKVERKLKKYYPTIVSVDLTFRDDALSASRTFEWMMVQQLGADFFWRDPYRNEVDIVLTDDGGPVPVEVKSGRSATKGLLAFMKRFDVPKGYIVTPDREGEREVNGRMVRTVPAFKLLLERGTADLRAPTGRGKSI